MNKRLTHTRAYIRFLRLVRTSAAWPQALGVNEQALFEAIVLAWAEQQPMTVKEATGMRQLGSQATLHKRMNRLLQLSLIEVQRREGDHRTKYLLPSRLGLKCLNKLGQALVLSVNT